MRILGDARSDERESKYRQLDRITASPVLHGSESLCRLLRFLAEHSIAHPGVALKEYQIATELFGRPPDFDPRLDSSVRVQTGRLRSKLAEYYAVDGTADPLIIEIPKGAYTLVFRLREAGNGGAPAVLWRSRPLVLTAAVLAVLAGLLWMPRGLATREEPARTFWKALIHGGGAPFVVYSNAAFVGRPDTGMRYFDAATDTGRPIMDHYTGVGEVMAIHALDRLFASLGQQMRLKRARLLTWDEARSSPLVFIGSTAENYSLREVPGMRDFVFARQDSGPRTGDIGIVNLRPRPGEPALFLASPSLPVREDYAVVALVSPPSPGPWVLILAGTTTFGTQAAGEFVCDSRQIERLMSALGGGAKLPPFEAVLRVKVSGGVPVQSDVAALRMRAAPGS